MFIFTFEGYANQAFTAKYGGRFQPPSALTTTPPDTTTPVTPGSKPSIHNAYTVKPV